MNLTPAQKVRLGAFIMGGVSILVVTLVVLAGLKLWEPRTFYRIRFKESISGLERSAPVKYQGLRVGRVEDMYVATDDPSVIEVVLTLTPQSVLFEGSQAVLDMGGLTGLKSINITPGDPRKARIAENAVLPVGPSLFDRITDNAAAIMGDVKVVTDEIAKWMTHENRERLESLLGNLDKFVGHLDTVMMNSNTPLKEVMTEVAKTTAAIGETAREATQTLHSVRGSVTRVETEAVSTMQAVQRPLRDIDPKDVDKTLVAMRNAATMLNARLSEEETGKALHSLGETLNRGNHLIQDVDLAVRAGRDDFTATLSYLRQAAEDLREFSRILAQNPSVLVRGRGEGE